MIENNNNVHAWDDGSLIYDHLFNASAYVHS
jgi:hypothetical protein